MTPVKFSRRNLCWVLFFASFSPTIAAKMTYSDAGALWYGAAQIKYFDAFLVGKQGDSPSEPAKSIAASARRLRLSKLRPPLDLAELLNDPNALGEAWLSLAEFFYYSEKYEPARDALIQIPEYFRRLQGPRYELLKAKLVLRGQGKNFSLQESSDSGTLLFFNRVLLEMEAGRQEEALKRLKSLAHDPAQPVEVRHRASLWTALILHQTGEKREALQALAEIDVGGALSADVLLAYLRINEAATPEAINAAAKQLWDLAPESAAAWEARERLLISLLKQGAAFQSGELAMETIASISATLSRLDKYIAAADNYSVDDLFPLLLLMPDGYRMRIKELTERRGNLLRSVNLIQKWTPFLLSYAEKLQANPEAFDAEILKESLSGESKKKAETPLDIFHLGLSKLIGVDKEPSRSYRRFTGMAFWELEFEYPSGWRPVGASEVAAELAEMSRGKRRKAIQAMESGVAQSTGPALKDAQRHLDKMLSDANARFAELPSFLHHKMPERAYNLLGRNLAQIEEIKQFVPIIEQDLRSEFTWGLRERRQITQQWLTRFALHALTVYTRESDSNEEVFFDLSKRPAVKKGALLLRDIDALKSERIKKTAGNLNMLPLLDILQSLITFAETRDVRINALFLRGQLTLALYESQLIPSPEAALNYYMELLGSYPDMIDRADITYQLARAQDLTQKTEQSLQTLVGFAKDYPTDPRINEVLFRIGESQFSLAEYALAKSSYEMVIANGEGRYNDQAEYKLAWTFFKQGLYREALRKFISVIDRATAEEVKGNDTQRQSRLKDAFRALSLTFAAMNGPVEVDQFFAVLGKRSYIADVYYNLAQYYLEHDRINDAVLAYDHLVRYDINSPHAPGLLAGIVKGANRESLAKLSLDMQKRFVASYPYKGTYWNQAKQTVQAEILQSLQGFLADLGQMYYADGQQQSNKESYTTAIHYFVQYVQAFPTGEKTPRIHFLMAEARSEIGDIINAIADYEKVAYQYGPHPDAAEAGYASLLGVQRLIELASEPNDKKTKLRSLVARSGRFASAFPADLRVDAVLVKASEDILMLGESGEAITLTESLLARNPNEVVHRRALILLAHAYFDHKSFIKAETAYSNVLALKSLSSSEHLEMFNRYGLSVYRQAETYRAAKDKKMAIDTFLRVAKVAPGTDFVPNAEVDAAALLMEEKRWVEAIDVLESFLRKFPQSKFAPDIPIKLAYAYENDGKLEKSAEILETLSLAEADAQLARQLLWRSAELREKAGRMDLAVSTFERYLKRYPAPLEKASEVRQLLADIAAKAKDLATRDRWLLDLLTVVRESSDLTVRTRFLAAKASIVFGDAKTLEFESIKLKLPLNTSLNNKRQAMSDALKWYDEAGRYAIAEVTTIATYKTAEIYRTLAKDLMTSERPPGLSALEAEQYGILLEEQSYPFEEKSTEMHEINYLRLKQGIYDEWVKNSMFVLRSLQAGRYDKVESPGLYFEYVPPPKVVEKQDVTPPKPVNDKNAPVGK